MKLQQVWLHVALLVFTMLTMIPFVFALNNSFRSNNEMYHSFFGLPNALEGMAASGWSVLSSEEKLYQVEDDNNEYLFMSPKAAFSQFWRNATRGYRFAWEVLRGYMLNTFLVVAAAGLGVVLFGSIAAYILSRYRFPGSTIIYLLIISTMMFPAVLSLVPAYLVVKSLGLLNTYWALILPYIAGGQVFAIFVFKGFFDGLPEELFESARIDGAGHRQIYTNIVLPLSKPIVSVVIIMSTIMFWNNFLWPFVVNTDDSYHVIASGLYIMATTTYAANLSTLFAAYMLSSIPLLILFTYATKPFIQGVTSGAFKA